MTYSGTPIDTMTIWIVIIGMAVGSFVLRFVFIGFVGRRTMPEWLLRHLRYTAVAMLPALVAPLVIWPSLTVGQPDVPRLSAAAVTLAVAMISKNVVLAIFCGAATLYGLLYLLGSGI
ncbi:AzlD domain-containing protein [Albibacillus kandeliae]|uniref:AzlD domain-containing protein n=1 Tax=Albibacillus kandeliae TaxID=2174228 RepID=UPI000D694A1F|nr:AzlD domain-containing protein [Albibacillus kandeliae]